MIRNIYGRLRRITTNQLYFPEIDGIRFLAISLVLLFHIHGYFIKKSTWALNDHLPGVSKAISTFLSHGDRGVALFFVLSGFILCLPFAHHYINNGKKVSLKRYYLRRLTRLEPPYIIALSAICMMEVIMKVHPTGVLLRHWVTSLGYMHNAVYQTGSIITVVAWSLEVEIQFYLVAPLLFKLLALPRVPRRAVLIVGALGFMWLQLLFPTHVQSLFKFIQYFLCGMLLADLYVSDFARDIMKKQWAPLAAFFCLPLIILLPINENELLYIIPTGYFLFPFLVAFFYYIVLKNDLMKRIFSYKFVPIIGGMCYSIYLLHYTIISIFGRVSLSLHVTESFLLNLFLQVVLLSVPILILSSLFYYYIERPFMSAKWLDLLVKKEKKAEEINRVS